MINDKDILKEERAVKLSILLILLGVIIVIGALSYAYYSIKKLNIEISNLDHTRKDLESKLNDLVNEINKKMLTKKILTK